MTPTLNVPFTNLQGPLEGICYPYRGRPLELREAGAMRFRSRMASAAAPMAWPELLELLGFRLGIFFEGVPYEFESTLGPL